MSVVEVVFVPLVLDRLVLAGGAVGVLVFLVRPVVSHGQSPFLFVTHSGRRPRRVSAGVSDKIRLGRESMQRLRWWDALMGEMVGRTPSFRQECESRPSDASTTRP